MPRRGRQRTFLVLALLALGIGLLPPIVSEAPRYVYVGAIQFSLFAFVAPSLLVLSASWPRAWRQGWLSEFADRRRHDPSALRSVAVFLSSEAVVIFWRLPIAVDGLVRHRIVVVAELVTLLGAGIAFWLELVSSSPLSPRLPRQRRMIVATFAMWAIWAVAYLVGLSHAASYPAYEAARSHGLTLSADQQIMAAVLWAIPACVFLPVIFANLMAWLRDEQDPDEEMREMTRVERRRLRWESGAEPRRG